MVALEGRATQDYGNPTGNDPVPVAPHLSHSTIPICSPHYLHFGYDRPSGREPRYSQPSRTPLASCGIEMSIFQLLVEIFDEEFFIL